MIENVSEGIECGPGSNSVVSGGNTDDNGTAIAEDTDILYLIEAISTATILAFIILSTIFGNVLVILSVFTYRPLQGVQNMFIVSLAVADITVAVLVMPFKVAYSLMRKWKFGLLICKMWLTCDVLCCTASILNLCAIALDRYWAIHDPINYARKRTLKRVMGMIGLLWIMSLLISAPPLIGWNDWPTEFSEDTPCMLTEEKGYVLYSASGSFFIPLFIMMTVYYKIFEAAKQRIRVKAKAAAAIPSASKPTETGAQSSSIPLGPVTTTTTSNEVSTIAMTEDSTSSTSPKTSDQDTVKDNSLAITKDGEEIEKDGVEKTTSVQSSSGGVTGRTLLGPGGNPRLTATVRHYIKEKQKICLLKERRAARVLGFVMGVFVLCWLPFFLMYVILPFCGTCQPSDRIIDFITWLGYVNSALNPVIYTVFNMDFRRAFSGMLCKKKR